MKENFFGEIRTIFSINNRKPLQAHSSVTTSEECPHCGLCYRIEKEACCGEDEYGNPTAIYSCIKMDCKSYNVSKEE